MTDNENLNEQNETDEQDVNLTEGDSEATERGSSKGFFDDDPSEDELPKNPLEKGKLYANKFKTPEDLEKGYNELFKKMNESPRPPKPTKDNPIGYDYQEAFKAATLMPPEEAAKDPDMKATYDQFFNEIREGGFSQKQFETVMKYGGILVQNALADAGSKVDAKQEYSELSKEWGDETDEKIEAVGKWARANLPASVWKRPLNATKDGLIYLEKLMNSGTSNPPLEREKPTSKFDIFEKERELEKLYASEDYRDPMKRTKELEEYAAKMEEIIYNAKNKKR